MGPSDTTGIRVLQLKNCTDCISLLRTLGIWLASHLDWGGGLGCYVIVTIENHIFVKANCI